jgi:hypothetical protein
MTIKYQNYKHYKLPITINPLDYGKLFFKTDNIIVIYLTVRTIAVLTQYEDFNEVKLYKEGDLAFSYKDHQIDENTFVRSLDCRKFTFKNNKLVNINTDKTINRGINSINTNLKIGIRRFSTIPRNIIKLRKVTSKNI